MRRTAVLLAGIAIASCSRGTDSPPLPTNLPATPGARPPQQSACPTGKDSRQTSSNSYSLLYCFSSPPDGNSPTSNLVQLSNGLLYGTTYGGGAPSPGPCGEGCGTIYSVDPSSPGTDAIVHAFTGAPDGAIPVGDIIINSASSGDTIYGTTAYGGTRSASGCPEGCGTVFAVTASGLESVLYSFPGGLYGANPAGGVQTLDGVLYGTTEYGGQYDLGTIFRLTPPSSGSQWTPKVIHSFKGKLHHDGAYPVGDLVGANEALYGVTSQGGTTNAGTVFQMTLHPSPTESPLHSFNAPDGDYPVGLAAQPSSGGVLFVANSADGGRDRGSVYAITIGGKFVWEYSFRGFAKNDGGRPYSGPTYQNGWIYGTTHDGGLDGNGTVYKIKAQSGTGECVIHSFGEFQEDGAHPDAPLQFWAPNLIGTTVNGGAGSPYEEGLGTVYQISPATKCEKGSRSTKTLYAEPVERRP
jgi:uncharacterized repeat protein (TIGR03803 family)